MVHVSNISIIGIMGRTLNLCFLLSGLSNPTFSGWNNQCLVVLLVNIYLDSSDQVSFIFSSAYEIARFLVTLKVLHNQFALQNHHCFKKYIVSSLVDQSDMNFYFEGRNGNVLYFEAVIFNFFFRCLRCWITNWFLNRSTSKHLYLLVLF